MTDSSPSSTTESVSAPRRGRGPLRMAAVFAATILVAGGIAFVATRDDTNSSARPKLSLRAGGPASSGALADAASPTRSSLGINARVHYVVGATLPALPKSARVNRLVATDVNPTRVAEWARVLHLDAKVEPQPGAAGVTGWQVTGSDGLLGVSGDPSMMYFTFQHGTVSGGTSAPGSGGGAAPGPATDPGSLSGSESCGSGSITPDGTRTSGPCPPTVDPTRDRPTNLPSPAEARRIGEQLLRELGVLEGEWEFETRDGGSVSVSSVCAADTPCAPIDGQAYTLSRAVVAHRLLDGHRISGFEWSVEVGDGGTVTSVNGILGTVETVADYPLLSVDAARKGLVDGPGSGSPVPALGVPEPAIGGADCGPAVDCVAPAPICPDPCPVPEVTITITGVSLGSQLWVGGDTRSPTMYVVPTYRFTGHDESGADWNTEVLALTADALAPTPDSTNPDAPVPAPPSAVEPQVGSSPVTPGPTR